MPRRKAPPLRHLAFCCILMLGIFVSGAVADNTVHIDVVIHLADEITGHWAQGRADDVTDQLMDRLVSSLNNEHPHWRFSPKAGQDSRVVVAVEATKGGSNEILLQVELRLRRPGHNDMVFPLGKTVLYEPAHFDAFGRPTPVEAEQEIWNRLKSLLAFRRTESLRTLSERVPLARNPSAIDMAERTVVLPLPKDRYQHLAWSTFRLHCKGQPPANLLSKASDQWVPFDPDLSIALKVTLVGDFPGSQLQGLTPVLVYLKKYIRKTEEIFLYDAGGNP